MTSAQKTPGVITSNGILFKIDTLRAITDYDTLLKKLTIIHRELNLPPEKRCNYLIEGEYIVIPRGLAGIFKPTCSLKVQNLDSARDVLRGAPLATEGAFAGLYDNQKIVVRFLMENTLTQTRMQEGRACTVLNLRAGMGKTRIAAVIKAQLGVRALYIIPNTSLLDQTIVDLLAVLPNAIVREYKTKPPKRDKFGAWSAHDVTIIVINSAIDQTPEFFASYDLIILDEVHRYTAPSFGKIFWKAQRPYMLGMSATTDCGNFDDLYIKQLGGITYADKIPGFSYDDVYFKSDVRAVMYHGPPEFTERLVHESTGKMFCHYMFLQFCEDPYRAALILSELAELYKDPDQYIYCFSNETDTLIKYQKLIQAHICPAQIEAGLVPAPETSPKDGLVPDFEQVQEPERESDCKLFYGGTNKKDIAKIKDGARCILTTYAYSGTGVSINKMTAIVFLEPRRSGMVQILGRILRRNGRVETTRKIVDIVDAKTPLKNQYPDRVLAYNEYKMSIVKVKHTFADPDLVTLVSKIKIKTNDI